MSKGMRYASHALLSGCSTGGVASIIHCDEFQVLMPRRTTIKCLADAGLFLDVADVAGGYSLRFFFNGVVNLQGVGRSLPAACINRMDATSCFFPQNLLPHIYTPTFVLNAAYDIWQFQESLAPRRANPQGYWQQYKMNYVNCNAGQVRFLQGRTGYLSIHVLLIVSQRGKIHGLEIILPVLLIRNKNIYKAE